jgi:hypothetical protein
MMVLEPRALTLSVAPSPMYYSLNHSVISALQYDPSNEQLNLSDIKISVNYI